MIFNYIQNPPTHPPTKLLKAPKIETYVILWPAEDESSPLPTRELK